MLHGEDHPATCSLAICTEKDPISQVITESIVQREDLPDVGLPRSVVVRVFS